MNLTEVAQTSGLLYRRLPACGLGASSRVPTLRATADYKSAIQQTRGLRYSTLRKLVHGPNACAARTEPLHEPAERWASSPRPSPPEEEREKARPRHDLAPSPRGERAWSRAVFEFAARRGLGQAGLVQKPFPQLLAFALLVHGTNMPAQETSAKHLSSMSIERADFGKTQQGELVELYTLRNANGLRAQVLTYGATIYSLEVPDKDGRFTNITANCASLADYETKSPCFGALLGRYANRIARGRFMLEGRPVSVSLNASPNHIHGGFRGFHKRVWQAEPIQNQDLVGLKLTYTSRDGEEGYPGTVVCTVLYELNNKNEWTMDYSAQTDKATVINLSNHAYWNLAGAQSGTVLDQVLTVNADRYLLADDELIPTGEIVPVEGTPVDFRTPHRVGERIGRIKEKQFGGGYDHCLVVNHEQPGDLAFCARLHDPKSGRHDGGVHDPARSPNLQREFSALIAGARGLRLSTAPWPLPRDSTFSRFTQRAAVPLDGVETGTDLPGDNYPSI